MKSVSLFADKSQCSGCMACLDICPRGAISRVVDEYGFAYPEIDPQRCIACGLCKKVCDFQNDLVEKRNPLACYAVRSRDDESVRRSSSGGVFTEIASCVLERGGLVCGCVFSDGWQVIHVLSGDRSVLEKMRGSKYVQSDVGTVYKEIAAELRKGREVLFCGTPCQVAALLAVLGNKTGMDKLIAVDLACHGVASQKLFRQFLDYIAKKFGSPVASFSFRSKKYGWLRFSYAYTLENGQSVCPGRFGEFIQPAFSAGNTLRPSCFSCKYACPERVGDFTIADCWGAEKMKFPFPHKDGLSTILINTPKARQFFDCLAPNLLVSEYDYQISVKRNVGFHRPPLKGKSWDACMEAIKNHAVAQVADAYHKRNKKRIATDWLRNHVPYALYVKLKSLLGKG